MNAICYLHLLTLFFSLVFCPKLLACASSALEEVLVNATRQDTTDSQTPYTITVFNQQQLSQQQVRNLPEALTQTPGVMVQKTANGHGSPFIRGFTGYRTLTLIDGIRYNNSVYRDGPNEYFSLIDIHSLDKIELLNGPASGLYGSDAIGGTLSLHSKPNHHNDYQQGQFYQTNNVSHRYAHAEQSHITRSEIEIGQGQSWGSRLGYSHKNMGDVRAADIGIQPHTGYDENSYDIRLDVRLNSQWGMQLLHQHLNQDDVWRTHSTIYARPFAATQIGRDQRRHKDQQRQLSSLSLVGRPLKQWLDQATISISEQQWRDQETRIKAKGKIIQQGFDSRMYGFSLALASQTNTIDWRYGMDYYRDYVGSWRSDYNRDGSLNAIRIQGPIGDDSSYKQWGSYIQADWQILTQHALLISSRYNRTRAEVGRYEDPLTALAASFDAHWPSVVSALRYSYDIEGAATGNTLWLGISQSFRAPNIADLSRLGKSRSNETEIASTNLQAEKFITYEIGLKTQAKYFHIEISYYYTQIRDFIISTPTGQIVNGLTQVSKQNAATGFIEGVELRGEQRINKWLRVEANTTWLAGQLDTATGNREPYSRIMPPTANLQLHWQSLNDNAGISLLFHYATNANQLSAGDRDDLQRIPPGGTPAYRLWHLRSYFHLNKALRINLALDNIVDQAYRTHGSGSNEPGRNIKLGFRYTF